MHNELMQCRVCGITLDDFPWGRDGKSPTYDYCPCCGVEFGYGDASQNGIELSYLKWVNSSYAWAEPDRKPDNWSLADQIKVITKRE